MSSSDVRYKDRESPVAVDQSDETSEVLTLSPPLLPSQRKIEIGDREDTKIEKTEQTRGRRPAFRHPEHTLTFADVRAKYPNLADAIISLCFFLKNEAHKALILRGRWGCYSTNAFRKAVFKEGEDGLFSLKEQLSQTQWAIIDNLHEQGMVFASYDSLLNYLCENMLLPKPNE